MLLQQGYSAAYLPICLEGGSVVAARIECRCEVASRGHVLGVERMGPAQVGQGSFGLIRPDFDRSDLAQGLRLVRREFERA